MQYLPFHSSGVLYLMRPSGAGSLTVPVFGGSLNVLVSITSPDLISLLCFPVQLHSISAAVGNTDSYINLLNTHWQRKQYRETDEVERENSGNRRAIEEGTESHLLNQFSVVRHVNVKMREARTSLKTTSLGGDLVHCMCLSIGDLGQVVLSGRQGRVGQRNNIC